MAYKFPRQISQVISFSIDGTAGMTNQFYTTENQNFIILNIVILLADIDSFSTEPEISIGTNNPDYNNIFPNTTLTGLSTLNSVYPCVLPVNYSMIPGGTNLFLNVVTPAGAITYDMKVFISGIYFE